MHPLWRPRCVLLKVLLRGKGRKQSENQPERRLVSSDNGAASAPLPCTPGRNPEPSGSARDAVQAALPRHRPHPSFCKVRRRSVCVRRWCDSCPWSPPPSGVRFLRKSNTRNFRGTALHCVCSPEVIAQMLCASLGLTATLLTLQFFTQTHLHPH